MALRGARFALDLFAGEDEYGKGKRRRREWGRRRAIHSGGGAEDGAELEGGCSLHGGGDLCRSQGVQYGP